ncbi:uncharacterized protein [Amphiura filiformis]|uniref:uncharacterized protein isoform X2 n=1 Tax=Amphiura filiformis TaxID=82378 RepID=UPI003B21B980
MRFFSTICHESVYILLVAIVVISDAGRIAGVYYQERNDASTDIGNATRQSSKENGSTIRLTRSVSQKCLRRKCKNGGSAAENENEKCVCVCKTGFVGKRCQFPDPCRICEHGGTAKVNKEDKCVCDCLFGYRGHRCQATMSLEETGGCTPVFECENGITPMCPKDTCCNCDRCTPPDPDSLLFPVPQRCACPITFTRTCGRQKNSSYPSTEMLNTFVKGCLHNFKYKKS